MSTKPILLLTRNESNTHDIQPLLDAGIDVQYIPVTRISPLSENLKALPGPELYQGLFFSSLSGAEIFLSYAGYTEKFKKDWADTPIYTLSNAVVEYLKSKKLNPHFCSVKHTLKGFLEECPAKNNEHWLHPCSTDTLLEPAEFEKIGVHIKNYYIYEPSVETKSIDALLTTLQKAKAIVFYSGSAFKNFTKLITPHFPTPFHPLSHLKVFSWGRSASTQLKQNSCPHILLDPCRKNWQDTLIQQLL